MTSTLTERGTHREQREHVALLHSYLTRYQNVYGQ
jgi:L-ribulose-5-phosphate 4-epimerase